MLPRRHQAITTCILLISTLSSFTDARKALGGSGGLLSRGSSAPAGGESASSDPLKLVDIGEMWTVPQLDSEELIRQLGKEHRGVAQYISNALGKAPLSVKLNKKRIGVKQQTFSATTANANFSAQEKYRAQVKAVSNIKSAEMRNSKFRSVWYISSDRARSQTSAARQKTSDLLSKSYDENMSHFHPAHFVLEVFLPKTRACKGGNPLVTYSIPMGAGTTSPKARVSQSNGKITVYPNGRKRKGGDSDAIEVGSTGLHLRSGPPLIDPSWSKGRKYFWKGRSVGQI